MSKDLGNRVGTRLKHMIDKLITLSRADDHDVFNDIKWPDQIEDNQFWMSPYLMSIYNTKLFQTISEEQLYKVSKAECISFFSLNVHGIRDLILEVVKYIHSPGFEIVSEYLHHFIDEENEHMYFFSRFCLKYGGKIYGD